MKKKVVKILVVVIILFLLGIIFFKLTGRVVEEPVNDCIDLEQGTNDIYVQNTNECGECSNNGDGQINNPFCSIQIALDHATTHRQPASIYVRDGNYYEDVEIPIISGTFEKKTQLVNYPEHKPLIVGADYIPGWEVYNKNTWKFENFNYSLGLELGIQGMAAPLKDSYRDHLFNREMIMQNYTPMKQVAFFCENPSEKRRMGDLIEFRFPYIDENKFYDLSREYSANFSSISIGNSFIGKGVYFRSSSNSKMQVSMPIELGENYAIETWIYPTNLTGQKTIFASYARDNTSVILELSNGSVCGYAYNSHTANPSFTCNSSKKIQINKWNNIVFSVAKNSLSIYIDGELSRERTLSDYSRMLSNIFGTFIGNNGKSTKNIFDGFIDELKIYKYSLTKEEVARNYNASLLEKDLVAQFKFEEVNSSLVYDNIGGYSGVKVNILENSEGIIFRGLNFNGRSYINFSNFRIPLKNESTISLWINLARGNHINSSQVIFEGKASYGQIEGLRVIPQNRIRGYFRSTSNAVASFGEKEINTGEWANIVLVLNKTKTDLYIDGFRVGRNNNLSWNNNSTLGLLDYAQLTNITSRYLGRDEAGSFFFRGKIDEFEIYNKALTIEEIRKNYVNELCKNSGENLEEGTYYVDYNSRNAYLRPWGNVTLNNYERTELPYALISIGNRRFAFSSNLHNVRNGIKIRNFRLAGFNILYGISHRENGAVSLFGDNLEIENLKVVAANGPGITFSGENITVRNNIVDFAGGMGYASNSAKNVLFENNTGTRNNQKQYSYCLLDSSGGLKFTNVKNVIIRNNFMGDNLGPGIHIDIDSKNVTIEKNKVYNNRAAGIAVEISENVVVKNNIAASSTYFDSLATGIVLSDTKNCEVYNNVVYNNSVGGIKIIDVPFRANAAIYKPINNSIKNNIFLDNGGYNIGFYTQIFIDNSPRSSNNSADYNLYDYTDRSSTLAINFYQDWGRTPQDGWRNRTKNDFNSIFGNSSLVDASNYDFRIRCSSKALNSGVNISIVKDDFSGKTRPIGRTTDMGAYESCLG